ncbi:MAG: dienelactone hydrolase family protein [Acidimicrobiales bacterium]
MEDHVRYLAEEVAYDHADGLLSRRDALRQLAALGIGAVGAASMLAACASDKKTTTADPNPTATTSPGPVRPPSEPAPAEAVNYPGRNGTLQGVWAAAGAPRGVIVVNHENRGITPFITSVVGRLAGDGYSALAVDLLSEEGGTANVSDVPKALAAAPASRFVENTQATVNEALRRQPGVKVGAIGFCFGGNVTWLMVENEPRLAAAAPFYGTVRTNVDFSQGEAAVLGVYAELDSRVNATREEARAALERAGLPHEIRTFPGVDHAFFNDTNAARYNAAQAAAAYTAVLDWFDTHLAR